MDQELPYYAVLDGGFGTAAVCSGFEHLGSDPLWSSRLLLDDPSAVQKIHYNFLCGGADLIETNTYQASISGFTKYMGVSKSKAKSLIGDAVLIAQKARMEFMESHNLINEERIKPLIVGSIGAYGASQHDGSEYTGNYVDQMNVNELAEWHRPCFETLLENGVDIIAFETIPAQKEADAIVKMLEDYSFSRTWISFSCKDGGHLCHGESITEVVEKIQSSPKLIGIGINCTHPMHISSLLTNINQIQHKKKIIVYPNSGEVWTSDKEWKKHDHDIEVSSLVELIPTWIDLGASWIGGCCRVTPNDIGEIRKTLQHYSKEKNIGVT